MQHWEINSILKELNISVDNENEYNKLKEDICKYTISYNDKEMNLSLINMNKTRSKSIPILDKIYKKYQSSSKMKDTRGHNIFLINSELYNDTDSSTNRRLKNTVIRLLKDMNNNDYVTIIFFSGESYEYLYKAINVSELRGKMYSTSYYDKLENIKYKGNTNWTIISNVLEETVNDFRHIVEYNRLILLTNGNTSSEYEQSKEDFLDALVSISLQNIFYGSMIVSEGKENETDIEFLNKVSIYSNGVIIHDKYINFLDNVFANKYKDTLYFSYDLTFYIRYDISEEYDIDDMMTIYHITKDNKSYMHNEKYTSCNLIDSLYCGKLERSSNRLLLIYPKELTSFTLYLFDESDNSLIFSLPCKVDDLVAPTINTKKSNSITAYRIATVFYAQELFKENKRLDSLSIIRDVIKHRGLSDRILYNSFTNEERVKTLYEFDSIIGNYKENMRQDHNRSIIDREKIYYSLSIIDILRRIDESEYVSFVFNDIYDYTKVSRSVTDKLNKFIPNEDEIIYALDNSLIFTEDRLNISIRYPIRGKVIISPNDVSQYNLPNEIEVAKWRNQTIIKDGERNTPYVLVAMRESKDDNKEKFSIKLLIDSISERVYNKNNVDIYAINLNSEEIPFINYGYNSPTIEEIADMVYELQILKAKLKVYNSYEYPSLDNPKYLFTNSKEVIPVPNFSKESYIDYKEKTEGYLEPKQSKLNVLNSSTLTDVQRAILKEIYGVNPKLEYVGKIEENKDNTELYRCKNIDFSIKGSTSIPSIKSSLEKSYAGKKLNLMDSVIVSTYADTKDNTEIMRYNSRKFIKKRIASIKEELFYAKIMKIKTGSWWDDLITIEENKEIFKRSLDNGEDFTLVVKTSYQYLPVSPKEYKG